VLSVALELHSLYSKSELHILEYFKQKYAYLEAFERRGPTVFNQFELQTFSKPNEEQGYDNKSITDDIITEIYLEFSNKTRRAESDSYLRTRTGK
jgi:hypothetical protein